MQGPYRICHGPERQRRGPHETGHASYRTHLGEHRYWDSPRGGGKRLVEKII